MRPLVVAFLAGVAALGGLFVTAANRWGAPTPGPCRDTVSNVIASCLAPQSPAWALALGALLPAVVLSMMGAFWLRRSHGR